MVWIRLTCRCCARGIGLSRESRSWQARTEVTLSSLGEHAYAWLARLVRAGVELFASVDGREPFVLSHATWDADVDVRASEEGLEMRVVARNGDQIVAHPRIDATRGCCCLMGGWRAARIEGLKALEGFPAGSTAGCSQPRMWRNSEGRG